MKVLGPKKPRWFVVSLGVGLAALGIALWLRARAPWNPGRAGGLIFGVVAALLILTQALYPLRRLLRLFPFGSGLRWTQFHVYGGALAFFFILIHEGFRSPSGALGWIMLALAAWAVLSGLLGVWIQKWIPAALASGLQVEAIFERIPELVEKLRSEAAALAEGSSEALDRFYRDDIEPALAGVQASWDYLLDVRGGRERRLAAFTRLGPFLAEEERPRLEDLRVIFNEKLELDAQYSLQKLLRLWTLVHAPPSILLFGFLLYHIAVSLYYR